MYKIFNEKVLQLIPIIFLIVMVFRISYVYYDTKEREYQFVKQEAELLSTYASTHRNYYQNLFINKTLTLNKDTIKALPAYSSKLISEKFSKNNPLNITVRTVSDRARNTDNQANKLELDAIKYFNQKKDININFKKVDNSIYHYTQALRIEQKCLQCHGDKNNAPLYIQENYSNAYDYKLGEVRGIVSINIPVTSVDKYFMPLMYFSLFYDVLLLVLLYSAIHYLTRKSRNINTILHKTVNEKTKELHVQLIFDSLTNLPNRVKLFADIEETQTSTHRHLALLNIDRFKDINDFYGHKVADKILVKISKKIQEECHFFQAEAYKLPSDEFAVYTTKEINQSAFVDFIDALMMIINQTEIEVDENAIYINFSCGTSSNEHEIITKADMALQHAKTNNIEIVTYDDNLDMSENITKNMQGIKLLKNAIMKDQITPCYQPIYHVKKQEIQKYECLARIILEDGQIIPPIEFLEVARKSKLYPFVTRAIITKSFEFFKDKECDFSINLSIDDIQNKSTLAFILQKIKEFEHSHRVIFEILESDKIGNYKELTHFIKTIKSYGCKFAIDDFGSGYSNFSHIFELNADYLKIDSSLVKFVSTDENSRIITKTIIDFASSLGLKTIAEFVEDKDSLDILEKMGVDYIQGYYIGRPTVGLNNNSFNV